MHKNLATIIFFFGTVFEIATIFLSETYVPLPRKGNSLIPNLVLIESECVHKVEYSSDIPIFFNRINDINTQKKGKIKYQKLALPHYV